MTEAEFRNRVNAELRAVVKMAQSRYQAELEHAEWQAYNITVDEDGTRWMRCQECGGSGRRSPIGRPGWDIYQCISCNGKGKKLAQYHTRRGMPC